MPAVVSTELVEQLALAVREYNSHSKNRERGKAYVGSAATVGAYAHGQGGLFSYPGMDQDIYNAMALPELGLLDLIPSRPTRDTDPLFGIITGQTAGSGSNPNGVCDDFPTAGLIKLCTQTSVFGRIGLNTPVVDIDRIGLRTNRGEFNDYRIVGGPRNNFGGLVPTTPGYAGLGGAIRDEISKIMFEFAVEWGRRYARLLYEGSPNNNTAGGGYKEFRGLDLLINTGYRDAITGEACPAADSYIHDFGSRDVATNGNSFVEIVTEIYRYLIELSRQTGLAPLTLAIALPRQMFYEITEVWPCAYMTYRCHSGYFTEADARVTSAEALIRMRDEMLQGQYLLIDGERVPVVFDDGIRYEKLAGGTFQADIYFVPLRVLGDVRVTYMEYVDYDGPMGAIEAARMMAIPGSFSTSDGGRFLWARKAANAYCVQMMVKSEPRLILRTPYLAARLLNVRYTPLIQHREWDPAGPSHLNGGTANRVGSGPSFYPPTA